ncbi:cysteine synthase-like [Choristoneura fumiferana]|uniref:cysteine synthase-like n=1 Tax=Choristoneura fumiferana TaxID=7141 RepID=UPI003D15D1BE
MDYLTRIGQETRYPNTMNFAGRGIGERLVHHSIIDFVGNTPLVKLNQIPQEHQLACEIYVKCEYMNPGGSIKDRIAQSMIADAMSKGLVHHDTEFVEPTSGNTGIGIAFACTQNGHKSVIVTTEKNSDEKVNTLRLLGAKVIQTKNSDEEMAVAERIRDSDPKKYIMLNQFANRVNPQTHYDTTAKEIMSALPGVDMLVAGVGTGGTVSGTAHRLKEQFPDCLIVSPEPDGSTMILHNRKPHPFLVEGIGGSKPDPVFDESIVDHAEVITDKESFLMARNMSKKEGILCGGSSGCAMMAAIKAAKKYNFGVGKKIVVILPDSIRNYMNKFVNDQWMEAHLFLDPPKHTMSWWNLPVTELKLKQKLLLIDEEFTCAQAVLRMNNKGVNVGIVIDDKGRFVGAVSKDGFRYSATNPTKLPGLGSEEMNFEDPVTHHLVKHPYKLARNSDKGMPTIGRLARVLDITPFVVLGTQEFDENKNEYFIPDAVATTEEVFDNIFMYSTRS